MGTLCKTNYTILYPQIMPSRMCKNLWWKCPCYDVIRLTSFKKCQNSWVAHLSISISCHPTIQITWLFDLWIASVLEIIIMQKFVVKCVVVLRGADGKCWVCVLAMSRSQWLWGGYAFIRNKELRCTLWPWLIRDFCNCDRDFPNCYAWLTQHMQCHCNWFCVPTK